MTKPNKPTIKKPRDLKLNNHEIAWIAFDIYGNELISTSWCGLSKKQAEVLHKWIGQAIAYLESKKGRK